MLENTNPDDEPVHHGGDKSFKVAMKEKETALEYLKNFFKPLYDYLDLTYFELDDTNYINKNFEEYYSDVVYRSYLKTQKAGAKKPVAIALLFEHKKSISSYFDLLFQLLEYIILIWKEDLANKRKPSLIVPIVVFQGKKPLKVKQLHDFFRDIPKEFLQFIPNFQYHLTNVQDLSDQTILELDEKGLLRSLFLAYSLGEKKETIADILYEMFKFMKYDQSKFYFFELIFTFISKEHYLSGSETSPLLDFYLSPKEKENVMTTYQVWKKEGLKEGRKEGKIEGKIEGLQEGKIKGLQEGKIEGLQEGKIQGLQEGKIEGLQEGKTEKARLIVLRGRTKNLSAELLADLSELPFADVENLLKGYDTVYQLWKNKKTAKPRKIEHLSDQEAQYLIDLFDKSEK